MENLPYFIFSDRSSLDFDLVITGKNTYKSAGRDLTFTSVPGRNGDLITDNGRYKNVEITYKTAILNRSDKDFADLAHEITAWLSAQSGYFKLYDTYDKKYYRMAAYDSDVDIEQELEALGKMTISFNCKPFKYSFEGDTSITLDGAGELYNAEVYSSKPYIKIYGSGNISLNINDKAYNFTGVEEYIEIDSEIMNAFKGIVPQNNKMTGLDFPKLLPGKNLISWTGNVQKIEVKPRWCCR